MARSPPWRPPVKKNPFPKKGPKKHPGKPFPPGKPTGKMPY
jgi:hypothetical protein